MRFIIVLLEMQMGSQGPYSLPLNDFIWSTISKGLGCANSTASDIYKAALVIERGQRSSSQNVYTERSVLMILVSNNLQTSLQIIRDLFGACQPRMNSTWSFGSSVCGDSSNSNRTGIPPRLSRRSHSRQLFGPLSSRHHAPWRMWSER